MAKYSGKDSDYLINQKVFDAFYKSLKGNKFLFILDYLKTQEIN